MAISKGKISPAIIEDIKNGVRLKFEEDGRMAYDFYNELTASQAVSDKAFQEAWKVRHRWPSRSDAADRRVLIERSIRSGASNRGGQATVPDAAVPTW